MGSLGSLPAPGCWCSSSRGLKQREAWWMHSTQGPQPCCPCSTIGCGLRPLASGHGMSRVVGGTNARTGAWPWIVSIQNRWKTGTGHTCGGSLISPQWVLTAAHCFDETREAGTWRVVIGATQLSQLGPEANVRNVRQLLLHEDYSNTSMRNDIALLELDQPVQCSSYIQLACVPDASVRVRKLKICYVSGWGATTARSTDISDVLQEAKVRLIDVKLCNSSKWYKGEIHTYNLCAGYAQGGVDTCQGDSGGPLACKDNTDDYYWLVGVTSWGKGCARIRRPGIYTSTQSFYDWITAQMGLYSSATTTPTPQQVFTSTFFQTPSTTTTQSGSFTGCLFPPDKLVKFFNVLQELMQFLEDEKS
ncbi:acrosin-like isoform X2 [Heliangelus exortis]|uniref:acrosin-like isoform X2 n=1 Tax=Heliangelus exortis TaxID=472823 RepID=UPI003A8F7F89